MGGSCKYWEIYGIFLQLLSRPRGAVRLRLVRCAPAGAGASGLRVGCGCGERSEFSRMAFCSRFARRAVVSIFEAGSRRLAHDRGPDSAVMSAVHTTYRPRLRALLRRPRYRTLGCPVGTRGMRMRGTNGANGAKRHDIDKPTANARTRLLRDSRLATHRAAPARHAPRTTTTTTGGSD